MLLKQMVKYIVKTDRKRIAADIQEYQNLRIIRQIRGRMKDKIHGKIVAVSNEDDLNKFGCKVLKYSVASNSVEPKWIVYECECFDGTSACRDKNCKYFEANKEYFTALEKYNDASDRCRHFWSGKFARAGK